MPLSRSATSPSDRLFYRQAIRFSMPVSRSASSFSDRLFGRPGLPFPVPQGLLFVPRFGSLDRLFRRPPSSQPTFPSRLFGWSARSLCRLTVSLRFLPLCGFYRPAVFTAPRFLPLRGFYRSAVFTAPRFLPLHGFYRSAFASFFRGLCSSTALVLAAPQSSTTSGRFALGAALRFDCDFSRSAVFTAPRFLPHRGFYRSAFTGSLGGFALPPPSCLLPPSLPPLPGGSLFGPPYGTPAIFTAPRFLPLRDFYRSAVFTAPRFLPLRDFYRPAVFTAPLSPVLWGALLFLSAPQSSPSSGRTLCYRLLRSVSGGTPFLIFFLYHLLNRSRSVTAHLTGFPFVHFIHIRGSSVVSSFE